MSKEIFELLFLVAAIVGIVFKNNYDSNKISNLLRNQITANDNKLIQLSFDFKTFVADYKFRHTLKNAIRTISTNIVSYETSLPAKYHNLLTNFAREYEEFIIGYFYSDARGKAYEIEPYLRADMEKIIANLEVEMQHVNPSCKEFTYTGGKKEWVDYKELIYKSGVYTRPNDLIRTSLTDKLIDRLVINGFKSENLEEFKTLVLTYIQKSFSIIIKHSTQFEELDHE